MIFIAFLYFSISIFKESFYKFSQDRLTKTNSNFKIFIIIAILINIFPLIPSGNFFNNWMSIVFYYPIAIFYSLIGSQK